MKLASGPTIVSISTNCSTANTAAMTASQRGNRPCLAAQTTGPAVRIAATVSTGPHMAAMSESVRAVAGSRVSACRASPASNHSAMPVCPMSTADPMVRMWAGGPSNRSRAWPRITASASSASAASNTCSLMTPAWVLKCSTTSVPNRSTPGASGTTTTAHTDSSANAMAAASGKRLTIGRQYAARPSRRRESQAARVA